MKIKRRVELLDLLSSIGLPKTVVEVGVAEGRFSFELYNKGVDRLYLVDLWETMPFIDGCASFDQGWHDDNYNSVLRTFNGKNNVSILKGFSHKVAVKIPDRSIGLVYIDSDHSYNGVKSDIKVWLPKLVDGGIMAFHDYKNPAYGVSRAVIEYKGEALVNIIEEDGKIENIGAWIQK